MRSFKIISGLSTELWEAFQTKNGSTLDGQLTVSQARRFDSYLQELGFPETMITAILLEKGIKYETLLGAELVIALFEGNTLACRVEYAVGREHSLEELKTTLGKVGDKTLMVPMTRLVADVPIHLYSSNPATRQAKLCLFFDCGAVRFNYKVNVLSNRLLDTFRDMTAITEYDMRELLPGGRLVMGSHAWGGKAREMQDRQQSDRDFSGKGVLRMHFKTAQQCPQTDEEIVMAWSTLETTDFSPFTRLQMELALQKLLTYTEGPERERRITAIFSGDLKKTSQKYSAHWIPQNEALMPDLDTKNIVGLGCVLSPFGWDDVMETHVLIKSMNHNPALPLVIYFPETGKIVCVSEEEFNNLKRLTKTLSPQAFSRRFSTFMINHPRFGPVENSLRLTLYRILVGKKDSDLGLVEWCIEECQTQKNGKAFEALLHYTLAKGMKRGRDLQELSTTICSVFENQSWHHHIQDWSNIVTLLSNICSNLEINPRLRLALIPILNTVLDRPCSTLNRSAIRSTTIFFSSPDTEMIPIKIARNLFKDPRGYMLALLVPHYFFIPLTTTLNKYPDLPQTTDLVLSAIHLVQDPKLGEEFRTSVKEFLFGLQDHPNRIIRVACRTFFDQGESDSDTQTESDSEDVGAAAS